MSMKKRILRGPGGHTMSETIRRHSLPPHKRGVACMIMDRIALVLAIIGGLNWGSVGLFRFDLVAWLFGGQTATVSRVVYTLVGLSAIWCISLLFRTDELTDDGI